MSKDKLIQEWCEAYHIWKTYDEMGVSGKRLWTYHRILNNNLELLVKNHNIQLDQLKQEYERKYHV